MVKGTWDRYTWAYETFLARSPSGIYLQTGKRTITGKEGGINCQALSEQGVLPMSFSHFSHLPGPGPHSEASEPQPHVSKYQEAVSFDILGMMWCVNSPNLNTIEPCWSWIKR